MGRIGAHPRIAARALAPLCLSAIVATGCGSGPRQDADEPKGNFPVEIISATFPAKQRLATTSDLRISVRNPGPKKVPVISVTVNCTGLPGATSVNVGGFSYRTTFPGVADPERPEFVVNTVPTRTPRVYDRGRLDPLERSSDYVDTFPLGSLVAGRTVTFHWNVTAVKAGPYRVCYRVNAGLDGKAKAIPARAGEKTTGEFDGTIAEKPPQAHIAQNGKTVVEGKALHENAP